jgi:hypothetical protein
MESGERSWPREVREKVVALSRRRGARFVGRETIMVEACALKLREFFIPCPAAQLQHAPTLWTAILDGPAATVYCGSRPSTCTTGPGIHSEFLHLDPEVNFAPVRTEAPRACEECPEKIEIPPYLHQ